MTLSIIILTGFFYLVPGMAEILYNSTLASGNMGLNGVYLDILNKRNIVYISGAVFVINLFMPFKIVRLFSFGLFIFSIFLYFNAIRRWIPYLT